MQWPLGRVSEGRTGLHSICNHHLASGGMKSELVSREVLGDATTGDQISVFPSKTLAEHKLWN